MFRVFLIIIVYISTSLTKMLQPCCNRGEKLSMAKIDNADILASVIGSNS
jgi:hypothetical protein